MAEGVPALAERARLRDRHAALRTAPLARARAKATPGLTRRAAGFVAARTGCRMTLTQLAAMPDWHFASPDDRSRLELLAGLFAAAPVLMRSLDGACLQRVAGRIGEDVVDRLLDASDGVPAYPCAPEDFTADGIEALGATLLADAEAGSPAAREICDRAWTFSRSEAALL